MSQKTSGVEIGYIRTQAIAYFAFALLFMRALAININSTKPFVSLDRSGLIPLPDFHFPNWFPLTLALICLGISIYFVLTIFRMRWMSRALRVADWLSIPFYTAVLASFIVTWLSGLNPLASLPPPMFHIFYWAGWLMFLALMIHPLISTRRRRTTIRIGNLVGWTRNKFKLIQWWLTIHRKTRLTMLALLVALVIIATLWLSWDVVTKNSQALTFIATCLTGVALAVFAWLTYNLSNRMVEYQYAPILQLYSVSEPEAGQMTVGATQFEGLMWNICVLNVGDVPVWLDHINIEISPAFSRPEWTSVGSFCICAVKNDHEIDVKKPFVINAHGDISIVIMMYDEKVKEHLQRIFGAKDKFIMQMLAYQRRRLGRHEKSGYVELISQPFELPNRLERNPLNTIAISLDKEPPTFHQP